VSKKVKDDVPQTTETPQPKEDASMPTFQERTESSVAPPKPKSTWHTHRRSVVTAYPDLNAVEQIIMAKKTYTPPGRLRSAQAIHREAFLLRNPNHGLDEAALNDAIRNDLISRI
jgi:hypothetical protein